MELYREIFGKRLKELRKKKRMNLEQLGKILNVSHSAISKWEQGRFEPELQDLVKISEIFEVSLDYLIGFDSEKYKNVDTDYECVLFAAKNAHISPSTLVKLIQIIDSQKNL